MRNGSSTYIRKHHAASRTTDFVFNQLIPYIGNKRKLLDLIRTALGQAGEGNGKVFVDLFSGSGVVSRLAKTLGYRVISNDWEPYTRPINTSYIACNQPPLFENLGGYHKAISKLNALPPRIDWFAEPLCPRDDENYDVKEDRMFYMRKNGMRIDAIRHQISKWRLEGEISAVEECCLLAPLIYQACYRSNTSGVFKGFHNGWGGKTSTALYRIATNLELSPAVFFDNKQENEVLCRDAQKVAEELRTKQLDIVYLDPPYNQHPYGSNYHVLNSVTLWDKPKLPKQITGHGDKSAIRTDWRIERRSAYNYRHKATIAYRKLIETLNAQYILTSYSTDGMIPMQEILRTNAERGEVRIEMMGYKRYRVSSQRFSHKPMNIEFVIVVNTHKKLSADVDELLEQITSAEEHVLKNHKETKMEMSDERQLILARSG